MLFQKKKKHTLTPERLSGIRQFLDAHLIAPEQEELLIDQAPAAEPNAFRPRPKRKTAARGDTADLTAKETFGSAAAPAAPMQPMAAASMAASLAELVGRPAESFSQMLLRLIDERGMSDPEVYKRAGLDRKHFSKIRSNPDYRPSKNTALALAVALRLDLDRTADLLRRAGYALSPASKTDLIVEYFLREGNYDLLEINEALYTFDENLLGG